MREKLPSHLTKPVGLSAGIESAGGNTACVYVKAGWCFMPCARLKKGTLAAGQGGGPFRPSPLPSRVASKYGVKARSARLRPLGPAGGSPRAALTPPGEQFGRRKQEGRL